jgi:hypothetical protein
VRGFSHGSGSDDSAHAGLDGQAAATADRIAFNSAADWYWAGIDLDGGRVRIDVASVGVRTLNIYMREDGLGIDAGGVKFVGDVWSFTSTLPAVVTSVVRANGQSGTRTDGSPINGTFTGNTSPVPMPAGGLKDGNFVFTDRNYPWSKIPAELIGAEYVPMFNTDKNTGETDVTYTVTFSRGALVLLTVDDRIPAEWAAVGTTPITFANTTAYKFYKVMFPAIRDAAAANSMQISEVELLGVLAK